MRNRTLIAVIGGGVVGLSTAYALWRDGHAVTLIEQRDAVASEASFANGGQLSYRYVAPLASPSAPFEAMSWLGRAGSPVSLHPNFDPGQWAWLGRFIAACPKASYARNTQALFALAQESQSELAAWRADGLSGFEWRRPGKLILYRNPDGFQRARSGLLDPQQQRVLSPAECAELEPAFAHLRPDLAGGIFTPDDEVADCHEFCLRLLAIMQKSTRFEHVHGRGTLSSAGRRARLLINNRPWDAEKIVVAAGMGSAELTRPLGLSVPIYPLKGYSLTLAPPAETMPSVSVTDYDQRVVYARQGERLRIAAMVDIGRTPASAEQRRIAQLRAIAAATLPAAGPYDAARSWVGKRPATPGGVPIVGRTAFENVLMNVGHGALGFTLAPGSARRIADAI